MDHNEHHGGHEAEKRVIVRQGALKKQQKKTKLFRKKYCILRADGEFSYFPNQPGLHFAGAAFSKTVEITGYSKVLLGDAEGNFKGADDCFIFQLIPTANPEERTYIFATDTEKEARLWIRDLTEVINSLKHGVEISSPTDFRHNVRFTMADLERTTSFSAADCASVMMMNINADISAVDFSAKDLRVQPPTQETSEQMISAALASFVKYSIPQDMFVEKKKIAEGGFGEVFVAKRRSDDLPVAVKIMKRNHRGLNLQKMLNEVAQMVISKGHPNVIECLDCYVSDTEIWLVMEYMYGGCLLDLLRWKDNLNESEIAFVCREVLKALAFLHSNHRLHRDIKSDNIVLGLEGTVKVTDFGFSTQLTTETVSRRSHCGTSAWMSPEVILSRDYGEKADMWSLGIMVLELAEGLPPYFGLPERDMFQKLVHDDPPTFEEPHLWSEEIKSFVSRLLVKDPVHRATAAELLFHPFLRKTCKRKDFAKLVTQSKLLRSREEAEGWVSFPRRGVAISAFAPTTKGELALEAGDQLIITSRMKDWFKGMNRGKKTKGRFPIGCVEVIEEKRGEHEEKAPDNTHDKGEDEK